MQYEVEFKYETSVLVAVEASNPEEAKELAQREFDAREADSLPEMWPMDFELAAVLIDGKPMPAFEPRWAKVDDKWFIKVPRGFDANEGKVVTVHRANGTASEYVLGAVYASNGDHRLFHVGRKVSKKAVRS